MFIIIFIENEMYIEIENQQAFPGSYYKLAEMNAF